MLCGYFVENQEKVNIYPAFTALWEIKCLFGNIYSLYGSFLGIPVSNFDFGSGNVFLDNPFLKYGRLV